MTSSESARVADPTEEGIGHLERDVSLEQGRPHVVESVVDLLRMELAAGAQLLERAVELGGQRVEHRERSSFGRP